MASSSGIRTGRCTNIGNCELADARTPIEVRPGADFVCPVPDCGKPLMVVGGGMSSGSTPNVPQWLLAVGAVLILVLLAGGAWMFLGHKSSILPGSQQPIPTEQAMLRLGGSNTIGDKLAPALAEGWLKSLGCSSVSSEIPAKDETRLSCDTGGQKMVVTVAAHGTETGFAGIKDGSYDLAMASDKIDADTAANLTALGDMNSPAAEHVIGFDGVAVIVNRGNTVPQLTLQQVAALFSGEITDWSKVGGAPGPVHVYTRDEKSGTRKFFERVVLKSNGKSLSPTARAFEKGTELADAVASDPGGIGFVGAASSEVARPVPIQAADGGAPLVPNPLTIRTQDYVLSRRLYLYVPPKRTSADAARFLSFVNSTAGEEIVQKSGFTPLTVTPVEKLAPPPNAPTGYVAATSAASRLTFNFYFRSGSSELDNLGINDLQTLANYLVQNHVDPARLLLIGFTDDQGDDAYNLRLSVLRAQRVSTELQRSGVRVGNSIGFGEALPTAPNSTEDGRNHNRRVEVWVKP